MENIFLPWAEIPTELARLEMLIWLRNSELGKLCPRSVLSCLTQGKDFSPQQLLWAGLLWWTDPMRDLDSGMPLYPLPKSDVGTYFT
jgi:hypothetical protein